MRGSHTLRICDTTWKQWQTNVAFLKTPYWSRCSVFLIKDATLQNEKNKNPGWRFNNLGDSRCPLWHRRSFLKESLAKTFPLARNSSSGWTFLCWSEFCILWYLYFFFISYLIQYIYICCTYICIYTTLKYNSTLTMKQSFFPVQVLFDTEDWLKFSCYAFQCLLWHHKGQIFHHICFISH